MGIRFKVDGKVIPSQEEIENAKNEYLADKDIPLPKLMSEEMTNKLWEVINENTELKQQLYFAEHRLEQIKRLLAE